MPTVIRRCFGLLFPAMALSALAAKPPAWTKGTDPAYPPAQYLIGVGLGKDLDAARSNARAEIARTLQARVQQTLTDVQTESSASVGNKQGPARGTQESGLSTHVSTDALLEGVSIRATHYDKKSKTHYALAVLDKSAARRGLSTQITEKEGVLSAARAEAGRAGTPVAKIRALARGLTAARERDVLAVRRRLLDPEGMADPGAGATHEVENELNRALASLPVFLAVDAPEGSNLKGALEAAVTGLGLPVAAAKPALTLTAKLTVVPLTGGNPPWVFYQWSGNVALTDPATQQNLAAASREDQEGHLVAATAQAKALSAGDDALAQEASHLISTYLFGN